MWGDSEYQHYLGADSNNKNYVSSGVLYTRNNAMTIKMTAVPNSTATYTMADASTGLYLSYCDGSCSGGKWVLADYSSVDEAMTVQLIPSGATPSSEW